MLTPLQQTSGMFLSDQLRSILDDVEARGQEAEKKVKSGYPNVEHFTGVPHDLPSAAAKDKISAYYFGSLKGDPDPLATLIARFSSALGVEQGKDESSFSFARRLSDAVAMLNFDKADAKGKPVKISLTSLNVTQEEVISILNGTAVGEQKPMAEMAARIAQEAGLTGEEDEFGGQISLALMAMRTRLPENTAALEEMIGLKELGLKAEEVIAGIANPWSDAGQKVKNALADKLEGEKAMTREMRKVIQRLEDVADPKTIDELKREETQREPGEVEDAQTKAEREQDIQNLENAEKLDDVRELQDAVKDHLDNAAEGDADSEIQDSADSDMLMIQMLAALPIKDEADNDNEAGNDNIPANRDAEDLSELDIRRAFETDERDRILSMHIDDNGIYDLLRRNAA